MGVLVTGGAGFIASHLSDRLVMEGHSVTVIDNLSAGKRENVNSSCRLVIQDIKKPLSGLGKAEAVFHFAADPEVKSSASDPLSSFENNVLGTYNVLEWCRKNDAKQLVFASTSTVYGETKILPTPEGHPFFPISNYGASKAACESYICSYAHTYGIKSTALRYANIFGERSTHGVIHDFFQKLKKDPKKLEILGNGLQEKSYLHVSDAINATLLAWKKQTGKFDVFNVGSEHKHSVNEIAKLVSRELGISPTLSYTGGERGWSGDVKSMLLDISKLKKLGWAEQLSFEEGLHDYIIWLSNKPSQQG